MNEKDEKEWSEAFEEYAMKKGMSKEELSEKTIKAGLNFKELEISTMINHKVKELLDLVAESSKPVLQVSAIISSVLSPLRHDEEGRRLMETLCEESIQAIYDLYKNK